MANRIFSLRTKVGRALRLRPAEEAWTIFKGRLYQPKRNTEFLKYAAVFLISALITGSGFWLYNRITSDLNDYTLISSPNGQISNVLLFDGTNVWLNAGSTLKYRRSFNKNDRQVFLEGEALFSVTENAKIPFIVQAGDARIKVFGTEFNVKAYKNEAKVETVLITGKVQFSAGGESVVMSAGDHLLYSLNTREIIKNKVNTGEYTSWKGGQIYFDDESLSNLTQLLERWYEVKFSFSGEHIKSYRFSGVINKDRSLSYTLNIIRDINKVEFEIKNENILIKDK